MKLLKALLFLSTCAIPLIATAAPYFTITKSESTAFPSTINTGNQAEGDYIVTNTSGISSRIYIRNLPLGFSQVDASGASPSSCGSSSPFTLASQARCTIRLAYVSDVETTVSESLPKICPSENSDIGCIRPSTKTSFTVIDNPTPSTTLSVPNSTIDFVPEKTTQIVITNTGDATANDVSITLPSSLSTYLGGGAVTSCASVSAGSTCTLEFPMTASLPDDTASESFNAAGSNTNTLSLTSNVIANLVSASAVTFNSPGDQSITVTNNSSDTITGLSLSLGSGTTNITANGGSTTCNSSLGAGLSCNYAYTAANNAYGQATATINFTSGGGVADTTTAIVVVANTSVAINPDGSDVGQNINGDTSTGSGSFTIKNTGSFTWVSPSVTRDAADSSWLTLSEPDSGACTGSITAGSSCTVNYAISGNHDLSSVITASGTNISETSQDFEPDAHLTIGVEGASNLQHFQYRALLVTNLTSLTQTLDITADPPASFSGKIILCNNSGSNCESEYASTCLNYEGGTPLPAAGSCHLWYKSEENTAFSSDATAAETISITTTPSSGSGKTVNRSINFTYGNGLYAGGLFTNLDNNSAMDNIIYWNGTSWGPVSTGATDRVYAMTLFKGDLYVGGRFTSIGGTSSTRGIANWNGINWAAMGTGISEQNGNENPASVRSITTLSGILYIAGYFDNASSVANTANIAQWDGSAWSAVGSGTNNAIDAITTYNGELYAGGRFTSVSGDNTINYLARWNESSWSAVTGSNLNNNVRSIYANDSNLYIGGQFNNSGGLGGAGDGIISWNGTSWSALNNGLAGNIRGINEYNSEIVAGGSFTNADGDSDADHIAAYDGSSWSALDSGLNGNGITLVTDSTHLYVGGTFTSAGGNSAPYRVARWNGSSWTPLGTTGGTNIGPIDILKIASHLSLAAN